MTVPVEYTLGTDAAANLVALRFESPAETEARRKALLAEAKAFRRAARLADRVRPNLTTWEKNEAVSAPLRKLPVYEAMLARAEEHADIGATGEPDQRNVVVMRCLWMALECEDEAASLSRSGAPRKNRKRGRNG